MVYLVQQQEKHSRVLDKGGFINEKRVVAILMTTVVAVGLPCRMWKQRGKWRRGQYRRRKGN